MFVSDTERRRIDALLAEVQAQYPGYRVVVRVTPLADEFGRLLPSFEISNN